VYGKPYLTNPVNSDSGGIDFSISHHGDFAIFAGQENCIIGADIMDTTQKGSQTTGNFFHTMRRQFTEEEWRYIRQDQEEAFQLSRFYRLWCLKESYVKALGRGIGFGVQRINCHPGVQWSPLATVSMDTELWIDGELLKGWTFEEQFIDHKHCVAVAVKLNAVQDHWNSPLFTECTISDLLSSMDTLQDANPHNWTIFNDKCTKT
jgi:4'-phosphopantetheinyl transferase